MSETTEPRVQPAPRAQEVTELSQLRSKKPRSLWTDALRQYRRHTLAMAGTIVLGIIVLAVLFGPILWPKSHSSFSFADAYKGVSLAHPMGTDDLGHDIFARVLWGGRISIAVGIVAML